MKKEAFGELVISNQESWYRIAKATYAMMRIVLTRFKMRSCMHLRICTACAMISMRKHGL